MQTKRCVRILISASICAVFLGAPGPASGRTLYVDDDAPGSGDGSSWAAAFPDLQDALAVAEAGDEIRVAQGVYRPAHLAHWPYPSSAEYEASFWLVDGTTVLGGFAGLTGADPNRRDPALFTTILTGDLGGDDDPNAPLHMSNYNSRTVVSAWRGRSTLDGVTVTRGKSRDGGSGAGLRCSEGDFLIRNCTFLENWSDDEGTIYNSRGTVRVEKCRFIRNEAWTGGGLSNSYYSTAEVIDCEFIDNYAEGGGGGIHNEGGNLRIERCRFLRNRGVALGNGGSVEVIASEFIENHDDEGPGAVTNAQGQAVFFGCLLRANEGIDGEGAIHSSAPLSLLYCTFVDNRGNDSPGALHCRDGDTVIAHCLFYRNAGYSEGAVEVTCSQALIEQCTFYANVAGNKLGGALSYPESYCPLGEPGPGVPGDPGRVTVRNCIFRANRALDHKTGTDRVMGYDAQLAGDPNRVVVEYCCIEGWTPEHGGIGNIGVDPLFVAPDQNDFHLQSQAGHWDSASLAWMLDDVTSPCIDAGDPNSPVGPEPFPNRGRVNMGVYGGTCEASKSWPNTEATATLTAADLNGDGKVDAEDYRLALQRWPPAEQ
jgi:hypothetical protein